MIVKLKKKNRKYADLSFRQPYFVIGIEADDFRVLNNHGKPWLYPGDIFEIIDSKEPENWQTHYGEDGERYSYPKELLVAGFFEDYFDGKPDAFAQFWQVINFNLTRAA